AFVAYRQFAAAATLRCARHRPVGHGVARLIHIPVSFPAEGSGRDVHLARDQLAVGSWRGRYTEWRPWLDVFELYRFGIGDRRVLRDLHLHVPTLASRDRERVTFKCVDCALHWHGSLSISGGTRSNERRAKQCNFMHDAAPV